MTTPERLRRRQIFESWLIAILCALLVASTLVSRANEAENQRNVAQQAERNTQIGSCLTDYAADLTDALQDRDVVNKTARAAQLETWRAIRHWLATQPTGADRGEMLDAIWRFEQILMRLQRTAAINPYPDISDCLAVRAAAAALRLVSSSRARLCFDRPATVIGTSDDDVIHGTDSDDVIRGLGGADIILGGKGNDYICGGPGPDTINGSKGHDRARGQRGADFCIQVENTRSC